MPRYLVQRTFPDGVAIPTNAEGTAICEQLANGNSEHGVAWVHSYVTTDKAVTYCVYDGPSPEAIRKASATNSLPVDRITEVRVLDPYFYHH